MATKNYMINDKWLDLDKQNIVELQSVDGVLDSLKVNGSEIETPSGKITITENGTDIDIAQYATADVNVEGGDSGSWQTVFEGSVTTEQAMIGDPRARIEGLSSLTAETIKVTFNGTEYTCEKQEGEDEIFYGDSDGSYSEYPFYITNVMDVYLITQTAGTYTLKIEAEQSGGGDFSTAEVTIINTGDHTSFDGCIIINNKIQSNTTLDEGTNVLTAVLYKGSAYCGTFDIDMSTAVVTGNAEYSLYEDCYIITGDCTITIS